MEAIGKRRNLLAALLAAGLLLSGWFLFQRAAEAAVVFGTMSTVLLVLLILQMRRLHDADLIRNNCILAVPSAVISLPGGCEQTTPEETVVSTFGVLIGSRIYKWGCDGVQGVRLRSIRIDRERMYLCFGDGDKAARIELLHGIPDLKTVMEVKQKLKHETGIEASISGWHMEPE
ncbi:MAG TPA: hypothetical protein PLU75_07315 [Oscillospiraceae bacterium]|nr:hypothetical protein [Oscillospiraceae bacterium]HQQ89857.1 hypothetical protein [Oscillospiraceae bacterium]HRW57031.1 hypothetical protein [Oscillospiraceae bacterium]